MKVSSGFIPHLVAVLLLCVPAFTSGDSIIGKMLLSSSSGVRSFLRGLNEADDTVQSIVADMKDHITQFFSFSALKIQEMKALEKATETDEVNVDILAKIDEIEHKLAECFAYLYTELPKIKALEEDADDMAVIKELEETIPSVENYLIGTLANVTKAEEEVNEGSKSDLEVIGELEDTLQTTLEWFSGGLAHLQDIEEDLDSTDSS